MQSVLPPSKQYQISQETMQLLTMDGWKKTSQRVKQYQISQETMQLLTNNIGEVFISYICIKLVKKQCNC